MLLPVIAFILASALVMAAAYVFTPRSATIDAPPRPLTTPSRGGDPRHRSMDASNRQAVVAGGPVGG